MPKYKTLPLDILKRNEFETLNAYKSAVWFLEQLNYLAELGNHGWLILENGQELEPDLRFKLVQTGKKKGSLNLVCIGSTMMIGHTRCCTTNRIHITKTEGKQYLKKIKVVHPKDIHSFLDL